MKRKNRGLQLLFQAVCLFSVILIGGALTGCDDSDRNSVQPVAETSVLTGVFADSPVEGLQYKTDTQSGVTDAHGKFRYQANEKVTFFIGSIIIGVTEGAPVVTPVDLVDGAVDETNPEVTNICRFLQTMDDDDDPENGILITDAVRQVAVDFSIDFGVSISDFQNDPAVEKAVSAMTAQRTMGMRGLALVFRVQIHFAMTLQNLSDYVDNDGDGLSEDEGDCDDDNAGETGTCPDTGDQDNPETECTEMPGEGIWTGTTDQGYDVTFSVSGDQVTEISTTFDYVDYQSENCVGTNILSTGDIAVPIENCEFSFSTSEVEFKGAFTDSGTVSGTWFYQNESCGGAGNGTWEASIPASDEDGDGFSVNDGDCNDQDATINPDAEEIPDDGIDQNCDGSDELTATDPLDIDDDGDSFSENQGDCEDQDATIFPGAEEICGDGLDQDCDGTDLICNEDENGDGDETEKVEVCHKGRITISISGAALDAHLAHGDTLGACDSDDTTDQVSDNDSGDSDDDDDD